MDEILERYKQGKFQKCLELIKLQPATCDLAVNFLLQNSSIICQCMVAIQKSNRDEINKINEEFHLFYTNVTSVGILPHTVPLQLKLTVIFNFYWWLIFNNRKNVDEHKCEEHLSLINSGLCSVLGKNPAHEGVFLKTSEKIMKNLCGLKQLIERENSKTVLLLIEVVVIVIIYLITLRKEYLKDCIKVADIYLVDSVKTLEGMKCLDEFYEEVIKPLCLFKFGLNKKSAVLSEIDATSIDYLIILKSTMLHNICNFSDSLMALKSKPKLDSPILNYLGALNSYRSGRKNLCFGFINRADTLNLKKNLKLRYFILSGRLCSSQGNHKDALKHFMNALNVLDTCPVSYFYIGHQWGKMGLNDLMVEYFEKLWKVVENVCNEKTDDNFDFDDVILDWLHPHDEITKNEALYALAISYGLTERFYEAADAFERLLENPMDCFNGSSERIIETPNWLTVLHDASITNLLAGNLSRAEEIAKLASMRYQPQEESHAKIPLNESLLGQNNDWLQKTIEEELLELDLNPIKENAFLAESFPEESIYFLPENVIALMILSEVQRIQKLEEEYSKCLRKIFSIFSNYLGSITKKEIKAGKENSGSLLIKALASKTCLAIAKIQIRWNNVENVEKMFKRSLSCNKGDKDVLAFYCQYLIGAERKREASKLWNTFSGENPILCIDSVQSLSLRYFLTTKTTTAELEKIKKQLLLTTDC